MGVQSWARGGAQGLGLGTLVFKGEYQALLTHLAISLARSGFYNVVLSAVLGIIPF